MKSIRILFILFLAVLFALSCQRNNGDENIEVFGIEFIPNFFIVDDEVVGIDADIASEAMQNASVDMELSMADTWQDAYNTILSGQNKALLTVAYTPERKDLFKWAGPTSQGMYGILGNNDTLSSEFPLQIEKCKQLPAIAVVKNWLETTSLEDLGFTNLVYYDTYNEALDVFMSGEVPFIASDFYHLASTLPKGYYLSNVRAITRYRTVYYYIAFSKDVSDALVNSVQNSLQTLIENQSTTAIVRKYISIMPDDYIAGTIQLFTEFSPPSSYSTGRNTSLEIQGSSVDIVNEIQNRTGYINSINLTLWNDAYNIVQYLPNSALFATALTDERENMFQWVGPISPNRTYFYTLSSSGLSIKTLEQAKALESIGTPNGWFSHDFLINNDFQNINATSLTSQESFNQLINGEVQALLMPDTDMKGLADLAGVPMNDLTQHIKALDYDSYIAFSLDTPSSTVREWQEHLDALKADGTFETIWNKWYSGVPMP
ncbi:MAG: ABC transporter substrate-binding protein [Candidatus Neomarinimicrobiota bacterium]